MDFKYFVQNTAQKWRVYTYYFSSIGLDTHCI